MCYESLLNGDATEKPVFSLLRGELASALKNGLVAALAVAVVLFWAGGGVVPTALRAVAALALGVALHQAVLLVGIVAVRTRDRAVTAATTA
jgi:Mg/Co/Ni transporter MgtE